MALMAHWLRRLADWLDPVVVAESAAAVIREADPLKEAADALIIDAEQQTETGGEYKRRWVYAKLQKQFPEKRKSVISMAIEVAVAARRG